MKMHIVKKDGYKYLGNTSKEEYEAIKGYFPLIECYSIDDDNTYVVGIPTKYGDNIINIYSVIMDLWDSPYQEQVQKYILDLLVPLYPEDQEKGHT